MQWIELIDKIFNDQIIKYILIVSVVFGNEYVVHVFDSSGNVISDDGVTHTIYAGDFIYCRIPSGNFGPLIHYGWMKIENEDSEFAEGPKFVSVENTNTLSSK